MSHNKLFSLSRSRVFTVRPRSAADCLIRSAVDISHPCQHSVSRHPNNRPSSHSEGRGGLGARPPLASQSRRPGVPQQRTGAESAPSGSNAANMPQNAGINPAPAYDGIFRHFISSLNPDDPSVTCLNAGALDFLSCLERDGRLFELRAFTSSTATDLNDIQRSLFKDCVKKTLTMAGRFEHEKRIASLRSFTSTSPHSTVAITHSQQNGDSRRVQQIPQRRMGISLEQMHGQRSCSPG